MIACGTVTTRTLASDFGGPNTREPSASSTIARSTTIDPESRSMLRAIEGEQREGPVGVDQKRLPGGPARGRGGPLPIEGLDRGP